MGQKTKIQWTNATWNPLRGCSRVSKGCENCYAEQVARRFSGPGQPYEGLVRIGRDGKPKAQWNGTVRVVPERFADPLRWTKPRLVFVNSMSDLFHEEVAFETIAAVFGVMAASPRHTFQVLTKRPARAAEFFSWLERQAYRGPDYDELHLMGVCVVYAQRMPVRGMGAEHVYRWPLPNVWLGVSVEDRESADARIPLLLHCPAAIRWVSYEPALGPVDFAPWIAPMTCCNRCGDSYAGDLCLCPSCETDNAITTWGDDQYQRWLTGERYAGAGHADLEAGAPLDWIVVGGESGPRARPFDLAWARSTIEQGRAAGVPVFWKQAGEHLVVEGERVKLTKKGGVLGELEALLPDLLPLREMPHAS